MRGGKARKSNHMAGLNMVGPLHCRGAALEKGLKYETSEPEMGNG